MSGGVDSSVAAALLVQQGYQVIGMMLRLWSEPGREGANRCCTPAAMSLARRVAAQLDIPFYAIDAKQKFKDTVVDYFLNGYAQGITPNPCLICNRHIRWELLLNHALSLGAEKLATGHYAQVIHTDGAPVRLLKGLDPQKDQSYVLSVLNQEQLQHTLLPIGGHTKSEIRKIAQDLNLPVANIKDSQDLCFLAGTDYPSFLERHAPQVKNPGPITLSDGTILGQHNGLAFYTIGQRKGLGIAAPEPLYVLEKDLVNNTLVVGTKDELGQSHLSAGAVNWLSGHPPSAPFKAEIKTRYTSSLFPGTVSPLDNNRFEIRLDTLIPDITPGQAAVVYVEQEVIANGIIEDINVQTQPISPIKIISTDK